MNTQSAIAARARSPWGAMLTLLAAILYGVSPIDLIPEILPLIGLLDDAIIVPTLVLVAATLWARSRFRRSPGRVR